MQLCNNAKNILAAVGVVVLVGIVEVSLVAVVLVLNRILQMPLILSFLGQWRDFVEIVRPFVHDYEAVETVTDNYGVA